MDAIAPENPSSTKRHKLSAAKRHILLGVVAIAWLVSVVAGLSVVWRWENTPGAAANSLARWPSSSRLARAAEGPTLVLLAHPQCSCTRATLEELGEVLARAEHPPKTYVVFLKPSSFANGWEMTDLWQTAARLPGVTVVRDDDGHEASRFGAATSGQTLLYDTKGVLLFSGGITGARGHAGDNAGRNALITFLNHQPADRTFTSVFGCPLFALGS
jgi:hypothetical protein